VLIVEPFSFGSLAVIAHVWVRKVTAANAAVFYNVPMLAGGDEFPMSFGTLVTILKERLTSS
jgi:hypothetical protein